MTVCNNLILTSFYFTDTMLFWEEAWAEITIAKKCEMLKLCLQDHIHQLLYTTEAD